MSVQSSSPQEEENILLPKTCYFKDGRTKVDYVIVYSKIVERVKEDRSLIQINRFIEQIKEKGLLVEKEDGKFHISFVYLKIHGPHKVLTQYARIYNIVLTCQNPYYKYKETYWFKWLTTELTRPNSDSSVYKRAEKTLSGKRPAEITTLERSQIVYEILTHIRFMSGDDEITMDKLLRKDIFLQAYSIHDGDCDWTTEGPLTDRQLLFKYWANLKYLIHYQPTHLIENYYGPKIGFYFALVHMYTKMLIVPSIVGTITIIYGYSHLHSEGHFIKFPGDVSNVAIIANLQSDLCKPAGCLVDLGMQLITIMIVKSVANCCMDFLEYTLASWDKYAMPRDSEQQYGQWEKDFAMKELDDSVIDELYAELVLQYGFITFFNASLPIIGLVALITNLLKIQHDSFRFLKLYRRPILKQVPDIEGWNHIFKVVTVVGCISNSFLVAFRTQFIQRLLYRNAHNGSYKGFINSTLSKFAIADIQDDDIIIDHQNETYCFYRDYRYPPEHKTKYQVTEEHWRHLAMRVIYFVILEKCTLLLSITLSYLIPIIPRKVKVKLEHDEKLLKALREAQMEQEKVVN